MQVTPTSFTIAEYCSQMASGAIVINHEYQRTNKVWPPAAKSYLIDTILHGYPIPKLCLFQKTDLKSKKTVKEIVDGQQRSQAILDFFEDRLKIGGKSRFSGRTYSGLDEDDQQLFVAYSVTTDVFVGATDDDIRQVFRRMNSYTVPLNPQEQRHATHQGEFKWFIVDLSERFAGVLKTIGVFSEKQLSRMADAALFTEMVMAMQDGIQTASKAKLNAFYEIHEASFPNEAEMLRRISEAFSVLLTWETIHGGNLMRPYNFYCLLPAITHCQHPLEKLNVVFPTKPQPSFDKDIVLANFGSLAAALDDGDDDGRFAQFVRAASSATNTKANRETRFKLICKALQPRLIR